MKKLTSLVAAVFLGFFSFVPAHGYDETGSMVKMRGTYGTSIGIDADKFLWKDANGDYQEKNFRYIDQDLNVNTYDKRIFDRYQLEIKTDTRTPFNGYTEIVVDPWSFVGVGQETVFDVWGDYATVKYKYWEATGKTINETYRTYTGNFVSTPEQRVIRDRVTHYRLTSGFDSSHFTTDLSLNRSVKIDTFFRPVRKLWVEYNEEPLYIKVFPIADQAEALTSDDPLRLSNNHVYWAPSPWLFRFNPGMRLSGANGIDPAKWDWDLAWFAEDSNRNYLTFLRGGTIRYKFEDKAEIDVTAAAPMSLWDYYEDVNSVPIAARCKLYPSDRITAGATYTSKYGIYKQTVKGTNHVMGLDLNYNLGDKTDVFGEYAVSWDEIEHADIRRQRHSDPAWKIGIKSEMPLNEQNEFKWDLGVAWMGENFYPGLSDYKDTRVDRDWGMHIWFDPISPEDEAIRIGDSVDINRYVLGMNMRVNAMDKFLNLYLNFRNAHETANDKFVENIVRLEAVCNPLPNLQIKGLGLYRVYPLSAGGLDPLLRYTYTDDPIINAGVPDGNNADVATLSGGAKLDLWDKRISVYGIYEATNDPQNFPRQILNNNTTEIIGQSGIKFNRLVPFLYSQDIFDLPPYRFYSIWKGVVTVMPVDNFWIKYTHVTNGNRNYAALIDNNHNHDSIEANYKIFKDMEVQAGYSLSRVIDLERANDTNGVDRPFMPHHNVFARLNWKLKNNQTFTAMYGEAWVQNETPNVFSTRWATTRVSVLDTRHIVRLFFQGKF